MTPLPIRFRDLTTIDECRAVVGIQEAVWGRDGETVPASVLMVSAKRGGVLIGAEVTEGEPEGAERRNTEGTEGEPEGTERRNTEGAEARLVGFVWSMPGRKGDRHTHWSHMLGVLHDVRGQRIAEGLKQAQRERAIASGVDLIEWTFDPLQAVNAHLNLHVLGAVGAEYVIDAYGSLAGPLHRGTPTDRLIVEWRLREPHVELRASRRLARHAGATVLSLHGSDVAEAPQAITTRQTGEWLMAVSSEPMLDTPRIRVPVPPRYSEMQQQATEVALGWRLAVRQVFASALSRGYLAVDFHLDREQGGGTYVLARA